MCSDGANTVAEDLITAQNKLQEIEGKLFTLSAYITAEGLACSHESKKLSNPSDERSRGGHMVAAKILNCMIDIGLFRQKDGE